MNFPEKVTFRFIDKGTKKPIEDIAAIIILYARRKNDYYTDPKFSNKDGYLDFTREDCLETIKLSQEHFIMDYSSSMEECLPKISLEILDITSINFIIDNFRL